MAEVINNADSANRLMLEGFRIGASKNAADLDRNVRIQELRSQQAHRQFMERQEAQQTQMLLEESQRKKQKFQEEIDEKAAWAKGVAEYQSLVSPMSSGAPHLDRDMAAQLDEVYGADEDETAMKVFLPLAAKYSGQPGVDKVMTTILLNRQRKEQARQNKKAADFEPGFESATNPVSGESEAIFRTGPNSAQLVQDPKKPLPTANLQEAAKVTELRKLIASEKDPEKKKILEQELGDVLMTVMPAGETIESTPGGGFKITRGKAQKEGMSAALQQEVSQKVTAQKRLVEGLEGLAASGADQFFNPASKVANIWLDKLYSNIDPGAANPERIQAFQKNNEMRNSSIRALTDDKGQLSEGDMRRISLLFPDKGIFNGSPAEARALWEGIINSAKGNARRLGESVGEPQIWAYGTEELVTLPRFFPGKVTPEMIIQEWKRRGIKPVRNQ